MGAILVRLVLLTLGLGLAEIGLDSLVHGSPAAAVELGLALSLLVAGSAGFIFPLLGGSVGKGDSRHV